MVSYPYNRPPPPPGSCTPWAPAAQAAGAAWVRMQKDMLIGTPPVLDGAAELGLLQAVERGLGERVAVLECGLVGLPGFVDVALGLQRQPQPIIGVGVVAQ